MALTSDLLDHWRKRLDRDLPPGTRLRWVLAGTGDVKDSDPPTNTAVLLDAETGETLVEQSKQYRFDLKPAQQRGDYAFDGFGATEVLYEDIDVSRQLKLVDLGTIRLAILICEDLGSLAGLLGKVHGNGASHVLAPVFAKPTRYWRWEEQAAEVFARAQGTATTVSNSLVLADLNDDDLPAPSSLVHTPYGFSVQRAAEPCDLMRYVVRDGHEPSPLDDEMPRPPA
jgi:predicted amidohydrolase